MPDWNAINEKKELDIAVGQSINICANKGIAPIEANIEEVMKWTEFILECKAEAKVRLGRAKTQINFKTESDL